MTDSIETSLARFETKLDTALETLKDTNSRVSDLESHSNRMTGALALLVFLIPVLIKFLV